MSFASYHTPRFTVIGVDPRLARNTVAAATNPQREFSRNLGPGKYEHRATDLESTVAKRANRSGRSFWDMESSNDRRQRVEASAALKRYREERRQQDLRHGPGMYTVHEANTNTMKIERRLPRFPDVAHNTPGPTAYADADLRFQQYSARLQTPSRVGLLSAGSAARHDLFLAASAGPDPGAYCPDINPPFSALKSTVPLTTLEPPAYTRFLTPPSTTPPVGAYRAALPASLSTIRRLPTPDFGSHTRFSSHTGERIQILQIASDADVPAPGVYEIQVQQRPVTVSGCSTDSGRAFRKTIFDEIIARQNSCTAPGCYSNTDPKPRTAHGGLPVRRQPGKVRRFWKMGGKELLTEAFSLQQG